MLRSLKDLEDYTVNATDGDIGTVVDFLLDDERWSIRYLAVDTFGFLQGVQVLISPISFRQADWFERRFRVALTKEKVQGSPGVDMNKPVSRQHELDYDNYYGYPSYWGSTGVWGAGAYPGLLTSLREQAHPVSEEPASDVHLRSAKELRGYHIQGTDDAIGHIDDFILDDETWEVRYLVVDTSNWWLGKKVLVSPLWAKEISWEENKVHLDLTREVIKNSPVWNPDAPVNREFETRLYDYYGRPAYWSTGEQQETPVPPL